jgi:hypothetical protein
VWIASPVAGTDLSLTMEPSQRTCMPALMECQLGIFSAAGNRCRQRYIGDLPLYTAGPCCGRNDQPQHPYETMSYYTPQVAHNQALMTRPLRVPARSTEFLPQLEATTQIELPVLQAQDATYTQQPNFVHPTSNAIPDILLSNYHQAFDAEPQPQPGHSTLPESAWEVFEQHIRTIFSEVEAGELGGIADRLTNSLHYLRAHIKGFGG